MLELKVRRIGNSLGVVLPREAVSRLQAGEGEAGRGDHWPLPQHPAHALQVSEAV